MKNFTNSILTILILSVYTIIANATMSNSYQYNLFKNSESTTKIQMLTSDPITLNPDIDEIKPSDPRIKSVMEYVKKNGIGVSVVFFNSENLRYVKKINELFQANYIFTDPPQLTKTKNMVDFNLVKIYVIEDKSHVYESKTATSPAQPNYK
ncbi:MAG: hypothetical protein ORN24_05725 [Burkholderiales bacterium]|nr:hypothetical protein [Burkholderiales bacterium]